MTIIYRMSDAGYAKVKPEYINNKNCLKNALSVFYPGFPANWIIIADNMDLMKVNEMCSPFEIPKMNVSVGHGAGTFNLALDHALTLPDNETVYFLENDYVHRKMASAIIYEGLEIIGADYVSLYDHPDKYQNGANPFVECGGEVTRVMLGKYCHWKMTNSTTMTFAAKVKTLREDEKVLREFTTGTYPRDFEMFLKLRDMGRSLITPIPGYATHGETAWMSPLVDWGKKIYE